MSSTVKNDKAERHLIDGHNLMHLSANLKKKYAKQPHSTLQWLINTISLWALQNKYDAIVYFDGKQNTPLKEARNTKVFESGTIKTADELIVTHCTKWSKKFKLLLYTDDRDLARKAIKKGIEHVLNKDLAQKILPIENKKLTKSDQNLANALFKQQNKASKREVEEMLLLYHLRDMDERE